MANTWSPDWEGINPETVEALDIYVPEVQVEFRWTIRPGEIATGWGIEVSEEWVAEYGLKKILVETDLEKLDTRFDRTIEEWQDKVYKNMTLFNTGANVENTQAQVRVYIPKRFFLLGHCDFIIYKTTANGTTASVVSNHNKPPQSPLPQNLVVNKLVQIVDFKIKPTNK